MKVLFLANLVPYPLDGGGKIFTFSVIKSLSQYNDLDLICFYEHENIEQARKFLEPYCNSINFLPIRVTTRENISYMMIQAGLSLFSSKPLGVNKYMSKQMKKIIIEKMQLTEYDCAVFNLLAMYSYADIIENFNCKIKTILYEQNCEALIYRRYLKESNNPFKKLFLSIETAKLEKFEYKAIHDADQLILLSKEDRDALKISNNRVSIIPIGVQLPIYQKKYDEGISDIVHLLFIGTMTWAPNNEGIIWFLKNVMPKCSNKIKYHLTIIGKNPSETIYNLCKKYRNVELLGYVDSLEPFYDRCDVLIVPLFIGSGQRVKIIEAFSRSFPVISTSVGVEGLKYVDNNTILIADEAEQFIEQINRCFDRGLLSRIGAGGKRIFDEEYATDVIAKKINRILHQ